MGRKRVHANNAARYRAYRARLRATKSSLSARGSPVALATRESNLETATLSKLIAAEPRSGWWERLPAGICYACREPTRMKAAILPVATPDGEHSAQVIPIYCQDCHESGRADDHARRQGLRT